MYSETASTINGIFPSAAPCFLMSRNEPVVTGIGIVERLCHWKEAQRVSLLIHYPIVGNQVGKLAILTYKFLGEEKKNLVVVLISTQWELCIVQRAWWSRFWPSSTAFCFPVSKNVFCVTAILFLLSTSAGCASRLCMITGIKPRELLAPMCFAFALTPAQHVMPYSKPGQWPSERGRLGCCHLPRKQWEGCSKKLGRNNQTLPNFTRKDLVCLEVCLFCLTWSDTFPC